MLRPELATNDMRRWLLCICLRGCSIRLSRRLAGRKTLGHFTFWISLMPRYCWVLNSEWDQRSAEQWSHVFHLYSAIVQSKVSAITSSIRHIFSIGRLLESETCHTPATFIQTCQDRLDLAAVWFVCNEFWHKVVYDLFWNLIGYRI